MMNPALQTFSEYLTKILRHMQPQQYMEGGSEFLCNPEEITFGEDRRSNRKYITFYLFECAPNGGRFGAVHVDPFLGVVSGEEDYWVDKFSSALAASEISWMPFAVLWAKTPLPLIQYETPSADPESAEELLISLLESL